SSRRRHPSSSRDWSSDVCSSDLLDDSAMVASFLSPEFPGTVPNFTLQPRTQDDYFNFQFTGYVNITTEGTYYFNVTSNDGSRLLDPKSVVVGTAGRSRCGRAQRS